MLGKRLLQAAVALCLSAVSLYAQDGPRPPAPATPEPLGTEIRGAEPQPRERVIYVPFKVLEQTFESPDANVVLPYSEYLKLRREWEKSQQPRKAPDAVITKSEYKATVEKDLARITATLTVNVIGQPWAEVPVQFGDAAVARVEGDQVLLRGTGSGQYSLLLGRGGTQTVTLELAVRVKQTPEGRELSFACPQVGVTTFELIVAEADQSIDVLPHLLSVPVEGPQPGTTHVKANLGSTGTITAKWHPRTSLKPEMELLTTVTNHTLVTIEDGLIHTDAYLTYDVLRGKLNQVSIAVPAGHRILDVASSVRVKSWNAEERDGQSVVTVQLLGENDKQVVVEVHTERKLPEDAFPVAGLPEMGGANGIHALDAVRESGQIAIRHSADLAVSVARQEGVIRIEQSELNQRLQGGNAMAFKYFSPRLTLTLTAKPVEPRITVGHLAQLVFQDDELRLNSQLQYQVERAGIFELTINLPEDLIVDNVQSPAMKEYVIDEMARTLAISLNEKTQGAIQVQIQAHRDFNAKTDTAEQVLPLVEPVGVERETGSIYVFAKEGIEVITNQEGLAGAQPLAVPATARYGSGVLVSAWSFTRRPVTVPVRTVLKPTRLSANVATTVDVQPETTNVTTLLEFLVEYAGIDTFRFMVPENVSGRVQITVAEGPSGKGNGSAIKQKTASEPANGWVTWTVVMQRETVGSQRLRISYDITIEAADNADAAGNQAAANAAEGPRSISVQAIRPLGIINDQGEETTPLTRVYGEVAVQKEQSLTLTADVSEEAAEPIDIRELTLLPPEGTLAYRYFKQPEEGSVQLTLTTARNELQEVVATVVSRGLVEIVTAEDAQATYRARYNVKTTERQRLLVALPANIEVLGVFVNEREVKLEKASESTGSELGETWQPYWVNVARTGDSDQPFLLTFQFLWTVNPPLGGSQYGRGEMNLPLPVIGGKQSSVAVQQLKVVVWVPKEYALVGDPAGFQLEREEAPWSVLVGSKPSRDVGRLDSWLLDGKELAAAPLMFPTEGRTPFLYNNLGGADRIAVAWWNKLFNAVWLSAAVALIGWVLVKTSWENKLGMLLLAALAAVLFGLKDSSTLAQGLAAAQFGIVFTLALWVIHEVGAWGRAAPQPANGNGASRPSAQSSAGPSTAQPGGPSVPDEKEREGE